MSETKAPKNVKSILTTAMENVAAKTKSEETDEQTTPTSNEVAAKRLLKKAGIAALVTIATVAAVAVIANRFGADEDQDETDEETTTSDDE